MHVLAFIFIHSSSRIDAKILDKTTMKEQVQTPIICLTRTRNNIISSQPHFALQHLKSLKEKNMKNFSMKRWSKFWLFTEANHNHPSPLNHWQCSSSFFLCPVQTQRSQMSQRFNKWQSSTTATFVKVWVVWVDCWWGADRCRARSEHGGQAAVHRQSSACFLQNRVERTQSHVNVMWCHVMSSKKHVIPPNPTQKKGIEGVFKVCTWASPTG